MTTLSCQLSTLGHHCDPWISASIVFHPQSYVVQLKEKIQFAEDGNMSHSHSGICFIQGFPGGSDGKVSACNAGDPALILGSGRSPGEGNGNPLQYSCLENPMDGEAWWATVHGVAKSWTRLRNFTFSDYRNTMFDPWVSQDNSLEMEMATHSSILAWKVPWTEEPGRLQSLRSKRVQHNWATKCEQQSRSSRNSLMSSLQIVYLRSQEIVAMWPRSDSFQ